MTRVFVVNDLLASHDSALLHGRELRHAFGNAQDLVFTNNQVLFAIQLDLRARVSFANGHEVKNGLLV